MYPLVQTLRGHEHDLGTTGDLRCSQRHRIDQNLPYTQRYKFHSIERKREFRERERKRDETFEDELLATSEDIGEGLEKGFEVSDGGVR